MKKCIIILGVLGAAFSAIFVRLADAPSFVLVFYRMLFSVLLLFPAVLTKERTNLLALKKKQLLLCILSGIFLGFHFSCYFESLRYTSISSSVVLVDTEVFFVALGGLIFLKEKIYLRSWIGILAAFLGSVIITLSDAGSASNVLWGDFLALLGAVFVGGYTLIGRICRKELTTTCYTFIVYFFAGLTVLLCGLANGVSPADVNSISLLMGLLLAVVCTLLGHSIFSWGLKYEKASFVSMAKLLEPVFASILGIFLFQEIPGISSVTGGLLIIAGIVFFILSERKRKNPDSSIS